MNDLSPKAVFDIEFSLSIYNRTGKYFIGKDIIDNCSDHIGQIYYWYYHGKTPPPGIFGKAIGRLQHMQVTANATGGLFSLLPKRNPITPLLHIDPFSVLSTRLGSKDVVICHDIGPITHPELFDPKTGPIYDTIYKEIAEVGPHIIFVSLATQKAFAQTYPKARLASQHVIYPPIRDDVSDITPKSVEGLDGDFLLTVGALGMRKNQVRAMRAFAKSGLHERGVSYVLCGAREPGHEAVMAEAAKTPGVVMLKYVTDEELAWLYRQAKGFVLPSLLEGFGMPVAEAIKHGLVPMVTADSVLEEVAGDGALSVDAEDEDAISNAMVALIDMTEAERKVRQSKLSNAITRFSGDKITAAWRKALGEMLTLNQAR